MSEFKLETELDYYDIVRQKLTLGPLKAPKHEKVFDLMKVFWDSDTIKILSFFPNAGERISLAALSEKSGIPAREIKRILRKATQKKTVSVTSQGYGLEPLVPGIFEAYYIARQDSTENLKKAAEIYRFFFQNMPALGAIDKNFELFRPLLPLNSREKLIQIDESVDAESQVLPYELVEDLINKNDTFAVITCQCRLIGELTGDPCKVVPSEMGCFVTGRPAKAIASFGWGKALTKEEAIEYLRKTEKAGLVHCTSNSMGGEHLMFICNCCSCHCGALKANKEHHFKTIKPSNYRPSMNVELCAKCETCLKKCPMGAISYFEEEKMVVNYEVCIGCGVCATNCPKKAILMQKVLQDVPPKVNLIGNKMFMQLLGDLLTS